MKLPYLSCTLSSVWPDLRSTSSHFWSEFWPEFWASSNESFFNLFIEQLTRIAELAQIDPLPERYSSPFWARSITRPRIVYFFLYRIYIGFIVDFLDELNRAPPELNHFYWKTSLQKCFTNLSTSNWFINRWRRRRGREERGGRRVRQHGGADVQVKKSAAEWWRRRGWRR